MEEKINGINAEFNEWMKEKELIEMFGAETAAEILRVEREEEAKRAAEKIGQAAGNMSSQPVSSDK